MIATVGDIEIARWIKAECTWKFEACGSSCAVHVANLAGGACKGGDASRRGDFTDGRVEGVGDEDIARDVERQTFRPANLAAVPVPSLEPELVLPAKVDTVPPSPSTKRMT